MFLGLSFRRMESSENQCLDLMEIQSSQSRSTPALPAPCGRPVECGGLWCPGGGWAHPAVSWYSHPQRPRAIGASACVSRRSQADRQTFARSLVVVRTLPPCVPLAKCANRGSPWPNPSPSPHNCWLPGRREASGVATASLCPVSCLPHCLCCALLPAPGAA